MEVRYFILEKQWKLSSFIDKAITDSCFAAKPTLKSRSSESQ